MGSKLKEKKKQETLLGLYSIAFSIQEDYQVYEILDAITRLKIPSEVHVFGRAVYLSFPSIEDAVVIMRAHAIRFKLFVPEEMSAHDDNDGPNERLRRRLKSEEECLQTERERLQEPAVAFIEIDNLQQKQLLQNVETQKGKHSCPTEANEQQKPSPVIRRKKHQKHSPHREGKQQQERNRYADAKGKKQLKHTRLTVMKQQEASYCKKGKNQEKICCHTESKQLEEVSCCTELKPQEKRSCHVDRNSQEKNKLVKHGEITSSDLSRETSLSSSVRTDASLPEEQRERDFTVSFSSQALKGLQKFSLSASDAKYKLKTLKGPEDAKLVISTMVQQQPHKNKMIHHGRARRLFHLLVDSIRAIIWYDPNTHASYVVKVQPSTS